MDCENIPVILQLIFWNETQLLKQVEYYSKRKIDYREINIDKKKLKHILPTAEEFT